MKGSGTEQPLPPARPHPCPDPEHGRRSSRHDREERKRPRHQRRSDPGGQRNEGMMDTVNEAEPVADKIPGQHEPADAGAKEDQ